MRKILLILLFLFSLSVWGQSTTVSTTGVIDTDSLTWANGTYNISFVGGSPGGYHWNGGTMVGHTLFVGSLNSSGAFSVSIPDSSQIFPSGTQWNFQICPNATAGCFSVITPVAGPTFDMTAALNAAAKGPRFPAAPHAFGYGTIEVYPIPQPGSAFLNTTTNTQLFWNGSTWVATGTGTGTVNPGQLALAQYPTSSASSVSPANFTYDSATGNNLTIPGASITGLSPVVDIRSQGAVIDGVTDIGPAVVSAMAKCNAANANSCTVLLPCAGPNGCYMANGSSLASTNRVTQLKMQGIITMGSTFVQPDYVSVKCDGGSGVGQFQSDGAICSLVAPQVAGTMGTATTNIGTASTFTPTYSVGSASNFQVNSAISVAGIQTCSATASRTTQGAAAAPNVTYTASSCTDSSGNSETLRIPVAKTITVTGCSDTSFNGTGLTVNGQDWPNSTINIYQQASSGSATGCTISGFDDNTYETVRITAVSGGNMTATFRHAHASTDLWGMVGYTFAYNTFIHHDVQNLNIASSYGMGMWLDDIAVINLEGVAVTPRAYEAGGTVECDGCWWGQWRSMQLGRGFQFQCHSSCTPASYPYGLRFSQDSTAGNGVGGTSLAIYDSTIAGGVKIDTNGQNNSTGAGIPIGPFHGQTVIEQPSGAGFMVDPRFGFGGRVDIIASSVLFSDNFIGNQPAYIGATDCCVGNQLDNNPGEIDLGVLPSSVNPVGPLVNPYWIGGTRVHAPISTVPNPASTSTRTGLISANGTLLGGIRGSGEALSPTLIPSTTLPVVASPSCGTCTSVPGPDLNATSAMEIQASSGTAQTVLVGNTNVSTYAGDWILFGMQYSPGTNQPTAGGFWGSNRMFDLHTAGTDKFLGSPYTNGITGGTDVYGGAVMPLAKDGWQPAISIATVVTGQSSSHQITLTVSSPGGSNNGNRFWDWWWMVVPGPNNPGYTGVTQAQVMLWAQERLFGYVPPNFTGGNLAIAPNLKMYWGNAVDIYSTGTALKTDQTWDASTTINSKSVCLADGTGCPASGGNIPQWLSYTGDGNEGALTCTTTTPGFEHWYSSFTVNAGQTCKVGARGQVLRVTGACTINGTLDASAIAAATSSLQLASGSGGGGGGGTAAGTTGGTGSYGSIVIAGGTNGASSGGNAGNGTGITAATSQSFAASGITADYGWGGGNGGAGGSSGGAGGNGGEFIVLICGSLTGTGTIRADGGYGSPSTANNTGSGGGGGGGVIITRSPADTSTLTLITNGGPGGTNVVPMAQWYGGGNTGLTTTATVTTGAISACSVGGTTTNWLAAPNCVITGGGGSGGTCHFTTSGSSPTLTITGCVVDTAGSGYTQSTFTTSGTGGAGGNGWSKQFTH